jgi:dUTP pyrophosphatase
MQYKLLLYIDKLEFSDCDQYETICTGYDGAMSKFNTNQSTVHPDAGFDLYVPDNHTIEGVKSTMVSHNIKLAMYAYDTVHHGRQQWKPVSYRMYPRSSFSKTSLLLANNVGIFDAGYRGHTLMALRNLSPEPYNITVGDRLMQICSPSLAPFEVERVQTVEGLNLRGYTARGSKGGSKGFGSTGSGLTSV